MTIRKFVDEVILWKKVDSCCLRVRRGRNRVPPPRAPTSPSSWATLQGKSYARLTTLTNNPTIRTASGFWKSGHQLRLDFRDEFNVEPSEECRFDYLEVRDGEHGYSPLIGKICGHQFPPMVTSSSRYLWIRFRSDENIEYSGFKALYSSIPLPTSS
ncbi:Neuropilin and tolloid-like protein 2 [Homalodisca vitripennis]|nr:Neuropilin and tolloid-like protein 2 [Homalodisca vitripennis]